MHVSMADRRRTCGHAFTFNTRMPTSMSQSAVYSSRSVDGCSRAPGSSQGSAELMRLYSAATVNIWRANTDPSSLISCCRCTSSSNRSSPPSSDSGCIFAELSPIPVPAHACNVGSVCGQPAKRHTVNIPFPLIATGPSHVKRISTWLRFVSKASPAAPQGSSRAGNPSASTNVCDPTISPHAARVHMRDAVLIVSPNSLKRGVAVPTTPPTVWPQGETDRGGLDAREGQRSIRGLW